MSVENSTAMVRVVPRIGDIAAADWDACANPETDPASTADTDNTDTGDTADTGDTTDSGPAPHQYDPFVSHAFLSALEDSRSASPATGWAARHLILETAQDNTEGRAQDSAKSQDSTKRKVLGCMPCYLKSHSQGEYIFDHGWADAYQRAGGRYYPKLQSAVPFTPVPGRRLLTRPGAHEAEIRKLLARAAIDLARRLDASSLHITFASESEWSQLGCSSSRDDMGLLQRTGSQFHWQNEGYGTFDDFLASLASRKRKVLRKERGTALQGGLTIRHLTGADIKEHHWDRFFEFYLDTANRKWGQPYLTRSFFSLLGERLKNRCLLIFCERHGRAIAGALNMIGSDCLYGRYWGAIEHHPCLHFEVCYYQAIDFAIAHGLRRVEAGAQGEHKLARGYRPMPTYSLHWIADRGLRKAVADYLSRERRHDALEREALAQFTPFKKTPGC